MKRKYFNIIVIITIAVFLSVLYFLGLLEKSAKFMLIPMLAFYYIGQYSERKLKT